MYRPRPRISVDCEGGPMIDCAVKTTQQHAFFGNILIRLSQIMEQVLKMVNEGKEDGHSIKERE